MLNVQQISWSSAPIGEGATRYAFKGSVKSESYMGFPEGSDIVIKVVKSSPYNLGIRLTQDDIAAQELTSAYCEVFSAAFGEALRKTVHSRIGVICRSDRDHVNARGGRYILKGEATLVESFIYGEYELFNSNTGWSADKYILPNFFSHWTYAVSAGQHLVCDLQGHRGRPGGPLCNGSSKYYVFTDPVVMTPTEGSKFGCTDLGMSGIRDWFNLHECNVLCHRFGIADKKPLGSSSSGRTYSASRYTTYIPRR